MNLSVNSAAGPSGSFGSNVLDQTLREINNTDSGDNNGPDLGATTSNPAARAGEEAKGEVRFQRGLDLDSSEEAVEALLEKIRRRKKAAEIAARKKADAGRVEAEFQKMRALATAMGAQSLLEIDLEQFKALSLSEEGGNDENIPTPPPFLSTPTTTPLVVPTTTTAATTAATIHGRSFMRTVDRPSAARSARQSWTPTANRSTLCIVAFTSGMSQ